MRYACLRHGVNVDVDVEHRHVLFQVPPTAGQCLILLHAHRILDGARVRGGGPWDPRVEDNFCLIAEIAEGEVVS